MRHSYSGVSVRWTAPGGKANLADSLFLQGMLSDTRAPTSESTGATTGPVHMEVGDCEPIDEDWENM